MSADLLYSEDEEALRASVRDLLTARAPAPAVLARTESSEPYDPALWRSLAGEMGLAGLAVPEALGGSGGHPAGAGPAGGGGSSWREVAVVAEELGRSVAGTPFLGSAVLATAAALAAGADELVAALASGSSTAAVAVVADTAPGAGFAAVRWDGTALSGAVHGVIDAGRADVLLVPATGDGGPVLVAAEVGPSTAREPVTSLDATRPLSDVRFDATPGTVLAAGERARSALDAGLTAGCVVLAAEQVGVAQRCLDLTVEYLKTRYQFGRPVGSFQALKHRCADRWAALTQARAVARYAADCLAREDGDTAVAAALAQAYCSPMAVHAAEECVQLHGGIGFTWEHPAHLYLKRAKADAVLLGPAAVHRARLAGLANLPAA